MRQFFQPTWFIGGVTGYLIAVASCAVLDRQYALYGLAGVGAVLGGAMCVLWFVHPDVSLPGAGELSECSTAQVCWAWHRSTQMLCHRRIPAKHLAAIVELRGAYLNEFQLRDPAGFDRWKHVCSVAAVPPDLHIRGTRPTRGNISGSGKSW
jgi:hypothetical protein